MRAIIVEDEPLSVEELIVSLREVAPDIEVVATAGTIAEAVRVIETTPHDLLFMDIRLGDGKSFDIFKRTKVSAPVIFITAYDSYALKAFENQGIDYLLKPFGEEDLRRAIAKLGLLTGIARPSTVAPSPAPSYQERFLVHMGARMRSVTVSEVAYFLSEGKYLHLITHDNKDYIVDKSLSEMSEKLSPDLFFRINRRLIISFESIQEMIRYSGSRIKVILNPPLPDGEEALVSADRAADFRKWLNR